MTGVEGVRGIEVVEAVEPEYVCEIGEDGGNGDALGDPREGNGRDEGSSASGFIGELLSGEGTFEGIFFVSTVS